MIAPVLSCLIETALGLGFIGWTGLNFSPLLYVLAFLVGARMVSNAVQVTHRYIEEFRSANGDKEVATYNTIRAMQMPNAAAVATDVIGFMVLGLANIPLMRDVAIMMSFWMLTILLEGTITPVIRSFLPVGHFEKASDRAKAEGGAGGNGLIPRTNVAIATFSIGRGRCAVGIGILLVFVCACYLATGFKVGDPTPGSPVLWPDHAYNVDQGLVNEEFNASSETFVLYFEGAPRSVYDPEVLYTFEKFDRHMRETLPDIYKSSMSLIDLLKMTNLTFHDGDQIHFQLPREPRLLEGIIGLVRNKAGTPALARYIDGGLERAQIILFFSDHVSENMLRIRHAAYGFFEQRGGWKTAEGEFRLAGGRIGMEIALNEETKRAHQKIDASVLVTIFVMCSLAFRSFVAGAMLTIPLLLSNMIAFAYMAMADIGLSVSTLPCSAIGVAVGVDFGIYLYSRCIEEYPRRRGIRDTVLTAVRTSGTGVVFTAMTVILPLFTWYFISGLKFQAQMGLFLAILILINLISALTLHPLMLTVINPRFVRRKAGAALS
jgi:predicted RND superfamily exporter protein